MPHSLWIFLGLMPSCEQESGERSQEPPTLPPALADCRPYAGNPEVLGYCVSRNGRALAALPPEEACAFSGSFEQSCRHNWAVQHAGRDETRGIEEIIAVCADDEDCIFEVIETRWEGVEMQLDLCMRYVTTMERHCVTHVLTRWSQENPVQSDVAVLRRLEAYNREVGHQIGLLVACTDWDACPTGNPGIETACELQREEVARKPERRRLLTRPR